MGCHSQIDGKATGRRFSGNESATTRCVSLCAVSLLPHRPTCQPLESLCRVPIALLEVQPSRSLLPFCHLPSSHPINLAGFLPHWGFLPLSSLPTFHPSHRQPPPPHPTALRGWPIAGAPPTSNCVKLVFRPPELRHPHRWLC